MFVKNVNECVTHASSFRIRKAGVHIVSWLSV